MTRAGWQAESWAALVVVVGSSGALGGCGGGDARGEPPPRELPSSCVEPPAPAPLGVEVVIGDGTPESCTNEALEEAAAAGGDLRFHCGGAPVTITITREVRVRADAIIDGGGLVTLEGLGRSRLLLADSHVHLAVRRLRFRGGLATATDGGWASGGAIRGGWAGSLDVRDCVFEDNVAGSSGEEGGGALDTPSASRMTIVRSTFSRNRGGLGGAVFNMLSGLTIIDSVFTDNESTRGAGGAVYTDGASAKTDDAVGGTIELCGCRFSGNVGIGEGGAAFLFAYSPDELIVNQCSFTDNEVRPNAEGDGLGGALRPGNARLTLANSLFARNHAATHGGALWVDGHHTSFISSSTFVENQAGTAGSEHGYGGALSGKKLVLNGLTVVGNVAERSGGAVFAEDDASSLANSLIVGNGSNNPWGIAQSCRSTLRGGHNLQWPDPALAKGEDTRCTSDVIVKDPRLGGLAANGGPTETLALDPESPAVDAGEGCPALDQRGQPRRGACDLGAYELQ